MGCGSTKEITDQNQISFKRNGYLKNGSTTLKQAKKYFINFLNKKPAQFKKFTDIDQQYIWGEHMPFENVISSPTNLKQLKNNTSLFNNSLRIIEPWENVGFNQKNEPVRASLNVQFITQNIADVDSVCYPLWRTGTLISPEAIVESFKGGLGCVFEGGFPDPYNSQTFTHQLCPRDYLFDVYKKVILNSQNIRRCIFICLSHQLLITALIELIKDFTRQAQEKENLKELSNDAMTALKQLAEKIESVGNQISVKKNGQTEFRGYQNERFATWKNEIAEISQLKLHKYQIPKPEEGWIGQEVIEAYESHAQKNFGVIEKMLEENNNIKISMFHSSEVNQESVLFASWAFQKIREFVINNKTQIRKSQQLMWILDLPIGVEIIGSTKNQQGLVITEAACYRVDFSDINHPNDILHFYSCQFHPELFEDLSDISTGEKRNYNDLQQEDGVNMLIRMLISHR